jgi:hypothetical protein
MLAWLASCRDGSMHAKTLPSILSRHQVAQNALDDGDMSLASDKDARRLTLSLDFLASARLAAAREAESKL